MIKVGSLEIGSGATKICVPLMGTTQQGLIEELAALDGYDLIEWRADFFEGDIIEMSRLLKEALGNVPLLLTFRTASEGGNGWIAADRFLEIAAHGTYDILDVELYFSEVKAAISLVHERNKLVLLSNHEFEKTPGISAMVGRLHRMENLGADICKLAVMPKSGEDVLELLRATVEAKKKLVQPLVTISMGNLGLVSRVTGSVFGSDITFAKGVSSSAAGQLNISDLKTLLSYFDF